MLVLENQYVPNNFTWTIPTSSQRRQIVVPMLLAVAKADKHSKASQRIEFNGFQVAEAKAEGFEYVSGPSLGDSGTSGWTGFIEAGQTATLRVISETAKHGETPPGITVLLGNPW